MTKRTFEALELMHEIEHCLAAEGFDVESVPSRYFTAEMWCLVATARPIPGLKVTLTSRAKLVDHLTEFVVPREEHDVTGQRSQLYVGPDKAIRVHRDKWTDRCPGFEVAA
ncbi:hypothetical protein ML5_0873 [Micromonospora sp. L5]|uniref:hypothetical protein n=1 Tax=Micromonospora sp. (strain L5) TaxID=648999 RepID=UPI0001C45C99|nr:hypothetical protein [Micromonospora sp. L5]ADU06415.1 hypothetical protein ML5_0873 [Micromonospora sp. L5]